MERDVFGRRADRQFVDEVAVEVAGGKHLAEVIAGLGEAAGVGQ